MFSQVKENSLKSFEIVNTNKITLYIFLNRVYPMISRLWTPPYGLEFQNSSIIKVQRFSFFDKFVTVTKILTPLYSLWSKVQFKNINTVHNSKT